ncbi:hypothetical protein C8T65DRAFT_746537 [Cerioporus squamosus]|nr:hypothetical protein C8T65DRAFT_746537 [Cerioporus squamosus]
MPALPQAFLSLPDTVPSFSSPDIKLPELPSLQLAGIDWDRIRELFTGASRPARSAFSLRTDRRRPAPVSLLRTISSAASCGATSVKEHPVVKYISVAAANCSHATAAWVQEHPEELKNVGLVFVTVVVLSITLYALCPAILAVVNAIISLVQGVLQLLCTLLLYLIKPVVLVGKAILVAILKLLGFTAQGVRLGAFRLVPYVVSFAVAQVLTRAARYVLGSIAAASQSAFYGAFTRGIFSIFQAAGALLHV